MLRGKKYYFETKPGLFSKTEIDRGSRLLIEHMDIGVRDIVIDLGCGYGSIGLVAASLASAGKVYLADTDIRAVKYSRLNGELNHLHNLEVLASDGFEGLSGIIFDVVLSNPPTHLPKEILLEFIEGSRRQLRTGGRIYFVTEQRVKALVKREFLDKFGNYEEITSGTQHVVSLAIKQLSP